MREHPSFKRADKLMHQKSSFDRSKRLLNFAIAGTQKAGTSTLFKHLQSHYEVGMALGKETHFFDSEERDWLCPDYESLHALLPEGKRVYGEATPITLYWTPAQYRMRTYNPKMKLILIFRDPIDRAFSNWKMRWRVSRERIDSDDTTALETLSFAQAIRCGRERVLNSQQMPGLHRWASYVERGFYGIQLYHLTKVFDRAQLLYLNFDELCLDHARVLRKVSDFLDIDPDGFIQGRLFENRGQPFEYPSQLTDSDVEYLGSLFSADLSRFVALSGLDISMWKSRRFLKA